ncbi:hypothetical protein SPRG_06784 [Saprolegnia parasitica CBS 223.65]|uniref:Uncharacterized protein n=1 Tax=Saprolegnia parasitica (strain CBS 223.65) TaxID=695850 RepID=A0A067CL28_SAPPC|nr:hypothetical protein SPRG_06784 [Saprolegnia parasitica CBS 223.65]KDO27517.1 hypothetical protein SPRG_06784 [Saprolegnia parasitica CBS 223.65]|eukprot:XP_012201644.1 hypothetical protein SPRG_06784 [Saprolegnia parasitica CBS 223.65]
MLRYTTGDVLLRKAHRGQLQEIKYLVQEVYVDVNYRDETGCTALHMASAAGQLDVVKWLLSYQGIRPNLLDHNAQSAIHYAAFYGHLPVVQVLLDHCVPLHIKDKTGRLPHVGAAINGHVDVVRFLLQDCPLPIERNTIDEYGATSLHWAAAHGRRDVVEFLLHVGVDAHVTSYDNRTAYQLAKDKGQAKCQNVIKRWFEVAQRLLQAAETGNDDEVKRVIHDVAGAYPLRFLKDKNGRHAMHWAASAGRLPTLRILAENFDSWTDLDKFGRNALHWAALGGHAECALWLTQHYTGEAKALMVPSLTNKTPARCALDAGHTALAAQLQEWEDTALHAGDVAPPSTATTTTAI